MSGADRTDQPAAGPRPGRVWVLLGLLIATGALLVAIIGIATREPSKEFDEVLGTSEAQRIFGGVRQLGDRLGFEDAPVQIQYFTDVQSVPGAENLRAVLPELVESEVRDGEVQLLFRNRSLTRNATQVSFYGVEAAAAQDAGWTYSWLVINNLDRADREGGVDREFLIELAEAIERVELPLFERDFDRGIEPDSRVTRQLQEDDTVAIELGLRAQPAMVVSGPGGTRVLQDSPGLARVRDAVAAVR